MTFMPIGRVGRPPPGAFIWRLCPPTATEVESRAIAPEPPNNHTPLFSLKYSQDGADRKDDLFVNDMRLRR